MAGQVVRMLPPSYERDDMQQLARIETWRRYQVFDASRGVAFTTYAYRAVRGACLMAARRRSYRDATALPLDESTEPTTTGNQAEDEMQRNQMRKLLGEVLLEIADEREREVLYCHHWREMSVAEIAHAMGVSASLIRMIRQQGYASLRERLATRGIASFDLAAISE
jgi:RNA polymerase sigma factor (sigma-70 family)